MSPPPAPANMVTPSWGQLKEGREVERVGSFAADPKCNRWLHSHRTCLQIVDNSPNPPGNACSPDARWGGSAGLVEAFRGLGIITPARLSKACSGGKRGSISAGSLVSLWTQSQPR